MMPYNVHVPRQWPIGVRYRLKDQSHLESRPPTARLYSPAKDYYAAMITSYFGLYGPRDVYGPFNYYGRCMYTWLTVIRPRNSVFTSKPKAQLSFRAYECNWSDRDR